MRKRFVRLIKYRFIIVPLILSVLCLLFYSYGNNVAAMFGLQWRPWVMTVTYGLFSLFKYCFIASVMDIIVKFCYRKYMEKPNFLKVIIATVFGVLVSMAILFMVFWDLFGLSMMHKPEHIVIRDGKKCVACVSSWHGSSVSCHEYKGVFFMGDKTVSYEIYNYSNDPFGSGVAPYEK